MIRSLIATIDDNTDEDVKNNSANATQDGHNGIAQAVTKDVVEKTFKVRRNLEQSQLEKFIKADDTLLWIDIVDPQPEELSWLADCLNLNPAVVQDLRRQDQRPALLVYPSYLFLSLFEPRLHKSQATTAPNTDNNEIHCIITETCFVTVRHAEAATVDDAYDRVAQNPDTWRSGVSYFLYLTSQNVIDAYYPLLDRVNNQLNTIEEKMLAGVFTEELPRKQVYRIKQQLIKLHRMVAPQREVFSNLIGEKRLSDAQDTRDLFRHLYERLLRVYDVITSQRDLSSDVLDMMQGRESRQLIETVNRLTIFSMVFLPLAFFTGLFELGFATTTDPFELPISGVLLFSIIMFLMIGSVITMLVFFKQRKWL